MCSRDGFRFLKPRRIALAAVFGSLLTFALPPGRGDDGAEKKSKFVTAPVERGNLVATVAATGTLQPEEVVDVGAQVNSVVRKLGTDPRDAKKIVDWGTVVDVGTVLAELDPTRYQLDLDAARAGLQRAEAELRQATLRQAAAEREWKRVQNAAVGKADQEAAKAAVEISTAGVDVTKAAIEQAKVAVRRAETELSYCTVKSPIKGLVIDRRVNRGQTVGPNLTAPTLFLIGNNKLEVWATVSELDIGKIQLGQDVTFTVDAFPGRTYRGRILPQGKLPYRLNATLNQNVVTYTVLASASNEDGDLLPYLTTDLRIEVGRRKQVLLVPNKALRWQPQLAQVAPDAREAYRQALTVDGKQDEKNRPPSSRVWIEDKGFVRPVTVRPGLSDGRMTELVGGDVAEGKTVVVGVRSGAADGGMGRKDGSDDRSHVLLVMPGVAVAGVSFAAGKESTLTIADADAIARECEVVRHTAPVVRWRGTVRSGERSWVPLYVYGTTPAYLHMHERSELTEGACFTDRDARAGRRVCLLGPTVAHELFDEESPLGKRVSLGNVAYTVVGVLPRVGANALGLDQDDIVVTPLAALREQVQAEMQADPERKTPAAVDGIAQVLVRVPASDVETARDQITDLLTRRHRIREGQPNDFDIRDLTEFMKTLSR